MKNISFIFSAFLCSVSLLAFDAVAVVATTSGSDLTGFNPSNAYNNQWASSSNMRYTSASSAKADFGNCNALIMRCAQPKCSNGGCTDMMVAANIVSGCVKSNSKCKQYGDDLIQYMSAQLVADSNAKANAANADQVAAAQAAAEQAQQAAQQAAAQQQQQMMEMQSNMQQQMMEMQQQMAEQQAQSAQQIASALAQNQQQQAAAISEMQAAAQNAARAEVAGGQTVTQRDEAAIERGVSEDVLTRNKITGQIMQEIEDAETQLKTVRASMEESFRYAKCDDRGNNCGGPRRVKKWRELASGFMTPYDNVVESIYNALITAQTVGVDLSDIYMMLNDSCNSWGEYLCPPGKEVLYTTDEKGQRGAPRVCGHDCSKSDSWCTFEKSGYMAGHLKQEGESEADYNKRVQEFYDNCMNSVGCGKSNCQQCTLLKILNNKDDVYAGWIDTESSSESNQKVIACASQALSGNGLFARKMKAKNGVGLVDVDTLDRWINQRESGSESVSEARNYCGADYNDPELQAAVAAKAIKKNQALCVTTLGGTAKDDSGDCSYINKKYGICDMHVANLAVANLVANPTDSTQRDHMNTVIATKVTVLSQQMYKQYEYLSATLRRLKTQLQKSVLTAQLQMAGAQSEGSSNASGSSARDSDKAIVLAGAENCSNKSNKESAYPCLQNNLSLIITNADSNNAQACKQFRSALSDAKMWGVKNDDKGGDIEELAIDGCTCKDLRTSCKKKCVKPCAQALNVRVSDALDAEKAKKQNMRVITLGAN